MATAPYQQVTVEMPCGHVYVGEGPKRGRNSVTPPARIPLVRVDCFCGQTSYVKIRPVLMVVGYKGEVL